MKLNYVEMSLKFRKYVPENFLEIERGKLEDGYCW